ncbi:MAG: S-layer homology domain-containing protein [Oscillospiraceae bacterium]|nr:S-layer homology domain-containing protein [Oscillospiraceae bacterium]
MKRFLSLMLAMILCLGAFSMTALAVNPFTDVPTTEWYYSDIDHAYQMELINGKTPTLFMPNDYLTYAEAVKLAACMNQRYTEGSVTLKNGEPWYQTYVDYCKEEGIISKDYSWNASATRAGYMEIFADALPDAAMKEINDIPGGSIPDVPTSHPQAAPIYKLYRVGILQGSDLAHNCNPAANIKRAEVAAILTRMMDSSKRIRFTMGEEPVKPEEKPETEEKEPLTIKTQPKSTNAEVGNTVTLSVVAEGGSKPYSYAWEIYGARAGQRERWMAVSNLTTASIDVKISDTAAGGQLKYRCVVTDKDGDKVTSDTAVITVAAKQEEAKTEPLKIIDQPDSATASAGDVAEFFIEVEGGTYPYSFEWMAIDGQGGHATVEGQYGVQTMDDAGYGWSVMQMKVGNGNDWTTNEDFYCVVTDANGSKVTSNTFTITLDNKPFTVTGTGPSRVKPGETATLKINVSGGKKPYEFQWMGYNEDDYSQGFTTGVIYWKGITVSSDGSTMTVDTSECEARAFKCWVSDAAGNKQLVEFEFSVY